MWTYWFLDKATFLFFMSNETTQKEGNNTKATTLLFAMKEYHTDYP